jgi:hypothetical protein
MFERKRRIDEIFLKRERTNIEEHTKSTHRNTVVPPHTEERGVVVVSSCDFFAFFCSALHEKRAGTNDKHSEISVMESLLSEMTGEPEIGKRYAVNIQMRSDDEAISAKREGSYNVSVGYVFKPSSVEEIDVLQLAVNSKKEVVEVTAQDSSGTKTFSGIVSRKVKESALVFRDGKMFLEPISMTVGSLKYVRDEHIKGEEVNRINVAGYMKSLSKRRRISEKAVGAAASVSETLKSSVATEPPEASSLS